jgi:hypothetical protein
MDSYGGELANVNRVRIGGGGGVECLGGVDPVGRLGGVECIPEHVLAPVLAGPLQRQARDLAVVPSHAAAAAVQHGEAVRGGVRGEVFPDARRVEEHEPGAPHLLALVEALHHGQQALVVDGHGAVDRVVARARRLRIAVPGAADPAAAAAADGYNNAIVIVRRSSGTVRRRLVVSVHPGELVRDAADAADAGDNELARAEAVEAGDLRGVVLEQERGVGRRVVLLRRGVVVGHEVVVEVVVAAHAHVEDAPAQVLRQPRRVAAEPGRARHVAHRRTEVVHLLRQREVPALQHAARHRQNQLGDRRRQLIMS